MKKLLMVTALLLSALTYANAQGGRQMGTPEERSKRQTEMLSTRLNLTPEQKTKIQDLFLVQAKTTDSLRTAANGDFQAMRGQLRPVQEATDKKILSLLTDEQKKQFEAYQEERRNRMQGQRQGNN